MLRLLIIDDSAFIRRVLEKIIGADPEIEVIGQAANGREGLDLIRSLRPDVVTMDIQMPEMDGLATLREMKKTLSASAPPVLMCSSLTADGSRETLEALQLGAADFITKDAVKAAGADEGFQSELIAKIKAIAGHRSSRVATRTPSATRSVPKTSPGLRPAACGVAKPPENAVAQLSLGAIARRPWDVLLIGASTGAPPVIEQIVQSLPPSSAVPIVIAQHMPELFTRSLAERLNRVTDRPVAIAEHGAALTPGSVHVGLGGMHVRIEKRGGGYTLRLAHEPSTRPFHPSVDELFHSGAEAFGPHCLGIVLTGMGNDGTEGAGRIVNKGGVVVTQAADSCVVYGMPRSVFEAGRSAGAFSINDLATLAGGLTRPESAGSNPPATRSASSPVPSVPHRRSA